MEFKKNDRVKLIEAEFEPEEKYVGQVGTVVGNELDLEYHGELYLVDFSDGERLAAWGKQLIKVEEPDEAKAHRFDPRDIRVIKGRK